MKNKNSVVSTDERTRQKVGSAAAVTLFLLWIALIVIAGIKSFKYGIGSITEELLLFIGSMLVFVLFNHRKGDVDLPKTALGRSLPVDESGRSKRIKAYLADSAIDAVLISVLNVGLSRINKYYSFTTIDFGSAAVTVVLNLVMDIIVVFAVFFALNYLWGEHNVKKYNQYLEEDDD